MRITSANEPNFRVWQHDEAVAGQTVVVEFEKKDRYGRVIGKVLLDGADMNLRQVEAGDGNRISG